MKTIMMVTTLFVSVGIFSQERGQPNPTAQLVAQLDKATDVGDYELLETRFAALAKADGGWLSNYYAALCDVRIGFLLQRDGERIESYSDRGLRHVQQALAALDTAVQRDELAEVYTVASLLYRTKVFINPMTMGPKYGPVAEKYVQRALQLNPDNPRAIYVDAWNKYHTPKAWGGDKEQARALAAKSLSILAKESPGTQPHWGARENKLLLK